MKKKPVIKTIALLFIGIVSLMASAANPAAGLYEKQQQKDTAYKPGAQQVSNAQQTQGSGQIVGWTLSDGTVTDGVNSLGKLGEDGWVYNTKGEKIGCSHGNKCEKEIANKSNLPVKTPSAVENPSAAKHQAVSGKQEYPTGNSPDEVALKLMSDVSQYCGEIEVSWGIYEKTNFDGTKTYYAANKIIGNNSSVPFVKSSHDAKGGGVLSAVFHNHPRDIVGEWPSVGDVMSGLRLNADVYVGGCKLGIEPQDRTLLCVVVANNGDGRVCIVSGKGNDGKELNPEDYIVREGDKLVIGKDWEIALPTEIKASSDINVAKFYELYGRKSYFPNVHFGALKKQIAYWNMVDFNALVPDKIWTEPIIGAMRDATCQGSGEIEWWGAKWMGRGFGPFVLPDGTVYGFIVNQAPYYEYCAPISTFSLNDAENAIEQVKSWIEKNIGVKLMSGEPTGKSYRTYSHGIGSQYCRISLKGEVHNVNKKGEKGVCLRMVLTVNCLGWIEKRGEFARARYSVRDLVQGKVK